MASGPSMPLARRALASLSLGGSAVGLGVMAVRDLRFGDWGLFGVALLVAAGAAGLSRRGILAQVLSRAVAWLVLTPTLFALADALWYGRHFGATEGFFAATSAGALLLARPAVHTEGARAEFAPLAHRRLFLAGAVASATAGLVMGMSAVGMHSAVMAALALGLVASAVGVARMRAWGVLLGALSSVGAVLATAAIGSFMWPLLLAGLPGLMLVGGILEARRRAGHITVQEPTRVRVTVASAAEHDTMDGDAVASLPLADDSLHHAASM
jgi:hypothetical protein